jgi:3-deoxy-D-manno-octulosonate 8-phosphate phosphatase (KDO 8-P phosphatase)
VDRRAAELGITPVVQGASQKLAPFLDVVRTLGLEPHQVAFMGDDLADLAPMAAAGLAACPSDAAPEVRQAAHFVAPSPGGRGAVRDLVEALLRSQHAWEAAVQAIQSA